MEEKEEEEGEARERFKATISSSWESLGESATRLAALAPFVTEAPIGMERPLSIVAPFNFDAPLGRDCCWRSDGSKGDLGAVGGLQTSLRGGPVSMVPDIGVDGPELDVLAPANRARWSLAAFRLPRKGICRDMSGGGGKDIGVIDG